jgi:hypothetical protein
MSCSRPREAASPSSRAIRTGFELRSDPTRPRPFGRSGVEIGAPEALSCREIKLAGINRPLSRSSLMGADSIAIRSRSSRGRLDSQVNVVSLTGPKIEESLVSVHSFSDGSLHSMRARLRTVALDLLTAFWGGSVRQYRPEAHYMRGPGPKWREKHGRNREAVGFVQRPVILNDKWDS